MRNCPRGTKKFLVLALTVFLMSTCFAQEKLTAKSVATAKQKNGRPAAVKFSIGMIEKGRVDPRYIGPRISDVVEAVEKISGGQKGEFESTADFNARKSVALSEKFLGDLSLEDMFAFVAPVAKRDRFGSGLMYEFDADASEVHLYVNPRSSSMNGIGAPDYSTNRRESKGLDQFDLDFRLDSRSTYQGSNAYGATVKVEKTTSTRFGVVANPISFLKRAKRASISESAPTMRFDLENTRAAKELPALKALVIVKIVPPYVAYDFLAVKPTRDDPREMLSQSKYLMGNILGVVFYSGLTGEIFAKIPEEFESDGPKTEAVGIDSSATR